MRVIFSQLPEGESRIFSALGAIAHRVTDWAAEARDGDVCGFCLGSSSRPDALFYSARRNKDSVTVQFSLEDLVE